MSWVTPTAGGGAGDGALCSTCTQWHEGPSCRGKSSKAAESQLLSFDDNFSLVILLPYLVISEFQNSFFLFCLCVYALLWVRINESVPL